MEPDLKGFYQAELPETLRMYNPKNPVCAYYHISRRDAVLAEIEWIRQRLLKVGHRDLSFLDAGCGDGMYVELVGQQFFRAYGVDISGPKLAAARKRMPYPSFTFLEASIEALPVPSDSISLVLCSEVMEHLPDPQGLLKELYRITAPGGYLLLTTPVHVSPAGALLNNLGLLKLRTERLPEPDQHGHLWVFSPEYVIQSIEDAGFQSLQSRAVPALTFKGLPRLLRHRKPVLSAVQAVERWVVGSKALAGAGAFIVVVACKSAASGAGESL